MPGFVEPCDPSLKEKVPTGNGWVYEIKTDGYRAQVHLHNGRVTIYSRSGYDWTDQFAPIAKAASELKIREAVLDGEVTVLGKTGLPDFQALRRELGNRQYTRLVYHAFDLLYFNGQDLRRAPLLKRKEALKSNSQNSPSVLAYVEFLQADGTRVFEQACRMGLEGIVAKRVDAPYRSGRQESWIKLKCVKSDTLPIVAFVEKLGARPRKIASLYVGRWGRRSARLCRQSSQRLHRNNRPRTARAARPPDPKELSVIGRGQEAEGDLGRADCER